MLIHKACCLVYCLFIAIHPSACGQSKDKNPCLRHNCTHNSHCVNEAYPNKTVLAKCECDSGYEWIYDDSSQSGMCEDINECVEPGVCSQICTNTRGGYKCECYLGYTIERHSFCRADGEAAWLYFANRRDIRRVRSDSRYMEIVVEETSNSIALDIDYEKGFLFWSDGGTDKIMRAKVGEDATVASDATPVISKMKGEPFSPDGLAVDWLYKKIYWTDTGSDTIRVANYDGDKFKTLISSGLDEPRAICVDPENGYMYWTDWGEQPKIEKCGMDGQKREIIVNAGDGLEWPNGLTIDYVGKRIYWIDAKRHKIGTARLDGTNKWDVLVDAQAIRQPFSISVFEDSLYWTDWQRNSILSVHKFTGKNAKTLSIGSYSVMDIKVYHKLRQITNFQEQAKSLCSNAQCEYMCLPAAKISGNATVSCVCADNQQLMSNKRSCESAAGTVNPTVKSTAEPLITKKISETRQSSVQTTDAKPVTTKEITETRQPPVQTTEGNDMRLHEDIATTNKAEIVTVQLYETAVLPCSNHLKGDNKVIWIGPDSKLLAVDGTLTQSGKRINVDRQSPNVHNLHINEVVHGDQGIYECRINSQPAVVKPVILVVQVSPSIQPSDSRYRTVYEGDAIELECISTGIPQPTVTWYRYLGDDKQTREKIEDGGGEIHTHGEERCIISNMSSSKAGTYECHASNGVGTGARAQYYVKYKPLPAFIVPDGENVTVQAGGAAVLPCAMQNLGEYQVMWMMSSSRITEGWNILWSDRFSIKRSYSPVAWNLQIKPVTIWDSGKYTCQLELHSNPTRRKIVNLIVTE